MHVQSRALCESWLVSILVRDVAKRLGLYFMDSHFLRGLYLVGTRGSFHVLANCLLLVFFGLPLNFQRRFVAQLQLFLFLFRLCLCDLVWLIFHATALRKYQSTSSTVKISPTSTYATILWEEVEQGVLTLFAGLQRMIFLLYLQSLTCGYRNEVLPVLLGMVKNLIFRKL